MITNRRVTSTIEELDGRFILFVPTADNWHDRASPWWGNEEHPWLYTYEEAQAQVDDTFFCFDAERGEGLPIIEKYADEIYKVSGNLCGDTIVWHMFGKPERIDPEYDALQDFFYRHADEFPTFVKAFKLAEQTQRSVIIFEGNC